MQWKNIFFKSDQGWKKLPMYFFPDRLDSTIYIPIFFARRRTFATVFVYTNVQSRFSLISPRNMHCPVFLVAETLFLFYVMEEEN